ncbi:carboxypeptidase-like regulatory domain-containing protein [Paucihalobacter ruber]|nr:carboxypeptidase-like regulatory domain-containing protein [Paucihalobacter ruber]
MSSYAQTLKGVVVDANTLEPIESATVYFDNTTIGTTTNANGQFSIDYTDAVQSVLVVSFLGYEKQIIANYRNLQQLQIKLKEQTDVLDEVLLTDNDGLTRKQKLKQFKKEFLGTSANGRSCKILNEGDIILRYHKPSKTLTATAKNPVKVINNNLQYEILYDIIDFEIAYKYVDEKQDLFNVKSVIYTGTTYYKSIGKVDAKKLNKFRQKTFKGSVQHFIRALYHQQLEEEQFQIFRNKFKVNPYEAFKITDVSDSNLKQVTFDKRLSVLYDKKHQSGIQLTADYFVIDAYGNYAPIANLLFTGVMGNQRLGDSLPFDFGLEVED